MSGIARAGQPSLPPVIALHHPEALYVWTLYRAFDRRFLPSQLMNEPDAWLQDMLMLDEALEALQPPKE